MCTRRALTAVVPVARLVELALEDEPAGVLVRGDLGDLTARAVGVGLVERADLLDPDRLGGSADFAGAVAPSVFSGGSSISTVRRRRLVAAARHRLAEVVVAPRHRDAVGPHPRLRLAGDELEDRRRGRRLGRNLPLAVRSSCCRPSRAAPRPGQNSNFRSSPSRKTRNAVTRLSLKMASCRSVGNAAAATSSSGRRLLERLRDPSAERVGVGGADHRALLLVLVLEGQVRRGCARSRTSEIVAGCE